MRQILLTAGIGDFLALESRFSPEFRAELGTIWWASRAYRPLAPILRTLPEYAHVTHEVIHDRWHHDGGPVICAIDRPHLLGILKQQGITPPALPADLDDWSIARKFRKQLPFYGSTFLRHELARLDRFGLPDRYCVVQADTHWNRPDHRNTRRMRPADVRGCLATLDTWGLPGVVLGGKPGEPVPGLESLRHLDDTTPAEAIQILKRSGGYCGIDSWLSVLAVQCLPVERLRILSRSVHLWANVADYYAPHTAFPFLTRAL